MSSPTIQKKRKMEKVTLVDKLKKTRVDKMKKTTFEDIKAGIEEDGNWQVLKDIVQADPEAFCSALMEWCKE